MRIALLGDIHGNLPALEAVLWDANNMDVEVIWNLGDMVGYGAYSEEVVSRLREEKALSILGNFDDKVLHFKKRSKNWKKTKRKEKWLAFKHAFESLSDDNQNYMRFLPRHRHVIICGQRFLLCHGSPENASEALGENTEERRLRELAMGCDSDVVICGHGHIPFQERVKGVWFVNTGSVGRPLDADPRACYALADIHPGTFFVEHRRVEYDVDRAANAIVAEGLPSILADLIRYGMNFPD